MRGPTVARGSARGVIGWTTGLLLAGVLPQYLVGSLAVEMQADFSFSDAQLGAAVGVSFAVAACVSPVAGRSLDRIGIRRGVLVGAGIVCLCSTALATVAHSGGAVIAIMGLGGLGSGIGSPSFSALLASEVGAHRHGIAFGLLTSAPQMAAFASGLALPLIAEPVDWRVAFACAATLSLICILALERRGMPRSVAGLDGGRPVARPAPSVYTLAGAAALVSAAGIGMRAFLVVFAVSVGFDDAEAGMLLAASGLFAMVSRLGFGMLGDRYPGDALRRATVLMGTCAVGFALMALGGSLAVVVGALVAGGLGWGWQSPLTLAVVTRNRDAAGAAMGIQMSGFFAGATVGPLLVGLLSHVSSYSSAWVLCALLASAAALVAMLARRQSPVSA